MKRNALLLLIFGLLAYGFWNSADFKTISAGGPVFLLGIFALEQGFKVLSVGFLFRCIAFM